MAAVPETRMTQATHYTNAFVDYLDSTLGVYRFTALIAKVCKVAALYLKDIGHTSAGAFAAQADKFGSAAAVVGLPATFVDVRSAYQEVVKCVNVGADLGSRAARKALDKSVTAVAMVGFSTSLFIPSALPMGDAFDVAHNVLALNMAAEDVYTAPAFFNEGTLIERNTARYTSNLSLLKGAKAASSLLPVVVGFGAAYTGYKLSAMSAAVNGLVGTSLGMWADLYGNSLPEKTNFFPVA